MLQILSNKYIQRGNYIYNTRSREKEEKKTAKNIFDNKKANIIKKKRLHDILFTRTNIKLVLTITINVFFFFFLFFFLEGSIYVLKIKSDSYAILHELEKMYKSDTYARRPCNDR